MEETLYQASRYTAPEKSTTVFQGLHLTSNVADSRTFSFLLLVSPQDHRLQPAPTPHPNSPGPPGAQLISGSLLLCQFPTLYTATEMASPTFSEIL